MNQLEREIEKHKKEIHSDAYPMSIGEAVSLYQNRELEIHPEFQRIFRWDDAKKTKFIESILLGIPIPSFFVSQRDDGVWDLVDGLQRFSTILSFMGELKNENGDKEPALELLSGEYLKSLKGVTWANEEIFTKSMKLSFRREKIDFKILKKESTPDTKFQLFMRINTGGSPLSDQEVRNCILIMVNNDFYTHLEKLSKNENFVNAISISGDKMLEQYHVELVVRFMVFYEYINNDNDVIKMANLTDFLNDKIVEIAKRQDLTPLFNVFEKTFSLIYTVMGDNAFKKYYPSEGKHKGGFSIALFEAISIGIAHNLDRFTDNREHLKKLIEKFSEDEKFTKSSGAGIRASTRIPQTIPYAIGYFHEQ